MSKDRDTPSSNTRSRRPLIFKNIQKPTPKEKRDREHNQNRSLSPTDTEHQKEEQIEQIAKPRTLTSGFNPAFQIARTPPRTTVDKPKTTECSVVLTDNVSQLRIQQKVADNPNSIKTENINLDHVETPEVDETKPQNTQESDKDSDSNSTHSNKSTHSIHSIHKTQSQDSLHSTHRDHSNHSIHTGSHSPTSSSEYSIYRSYTPKQSDEESDMGEETLEIKDIALTMPYFEGFQKDLDYFISTCKTYNEMVTEAQRPLLLQVIKTKFKGIALAKMEPLTTLNSWAEVKTRLEEKFKRPNTYEHAQDEITKIHQARNETIEVYGNRFRMALHRLNKAAENLTDSPEGLKVLRETNEKYAVRKFEQNIHNSELKFWVKMKTCQTLDAAIVVAMEEEDQFDIPRKLVCNYCNRDGHTERDCRQKQRERNQNFPNRAESNRNNQYYQNRFSNDPNSPPKHNYNGINNSNAYNNKNSKTPYLNKNNENDNRYQPVRNTNPNNYANNYGNNPNRNPNKNKKYTTNEGNESDPSNSQNARVSKNETTTPLTLNDVLKKEAKN